MNRGDAAEMGSRRKYAVSEVVGFVFVLMIVMGAISFILFWGVPYMEQQSAKARLDSVLTQFDIINSKVRDEIIRQGSGSSSIVSLTTDAGNVYINSKGERFIFYYSMDPSFEFNVSRLEDDNDNHFVFKLEQGEAYLIRIYFLYDATRPPIDKTRSNGLNFTAGGSGTYQITSLSPNYLHDAVQMDIINWYDDIIGRIWLFDAGSILYEDLSPAGVYNVLAQNGGIISSSSTSGFVYSKPNIIMDNERLAMRIIQFKPVTALSGSGQATYTFTIKLNYSDIRVESESIRNSFRMQIYGDDTAVNAWTQYFTTTFGFETFVGSSADGTLYLPGDRMFTLSQSICKVSMEMS